MNVPSGARTVAPVGWVDGNGDPAAGPVALTAVNAVTGSPVYLSSGLVPGAMAIVASTPLSGVALVDGTPTILSWTAPDDGELHTVNLNGLLVVSSDETGGEVAVDFTLGGTAYNESLMSASLTVGLHTFLNSLNDTCWIVVDPSTTVSIVQASALSAGASALYATLFAQ